MKNILKRIATAGDRLRRLIKNDETIEGAYLKITFEPPEGTVCVAYQLQSQLAYEFVSLGVDIVLMIYPPGNTPGQVGSDTRHTEDRTRFGNGAG